MDMENAESDVLGSNDEFYVPQLLSSTPSTDGESNPLAKFYRDRGEWLARLVGQTEYNDDDDAKKRISPALRGRVRAQARSDLFKAYELDPGNWSTYNALANFLARSNNNADMIKAIQVWSRGSERDLATRELRDKVAPAVDY